MTARFDRAECPGEECMACTGEVCRLCGAGLWNRDPDRNCEHDVTDRHIDGLAGAEPRATLDT